MSSVDVEWANANTVKMLSSTEKAGAACRRFLIFVVPNGTTKSPFLQVKSDQRNYDLAIRFYESPGINENLLEQAEFVMTGGLSKFHAAFMFLKDSGLLNSYDGYLFLDGDLEFDATLLNNFLCFVHAASLDLAQPSLTRDSYGYWKMAYHQPGYVFRQTSFVEVMAPYLSQAALVRVFPTFARSISAYGLDLVWPSLIGNDRIGVVDAFQVRHSEKVDHASGKFYKYLKSIGVDLDEEERIILKEYGVVPEQAHSRRGFFWKYGNPLIRRTPKLASVALNAPEKRTESQISIDVAMALARWRQARAEDDLTQLLLPLLNGNEIARSFTTRSA